MKRVAIINSGICNLTSVLNAFEYLSMDVEIVDTGIDFDRFSHLVLPGVGAFMQGMQKLRGKGLDEAIRRDVEKGKPLLGICLGMQLLASKGEEFGITEGLGLIPGDITKMKLSAPGLRLPHVGWNDVGYPRSSILWKGIEEHSSFYFIHSFAYTHIPNEFVIGHCEYGDMVVAAIQKEHVFGVQFHPEKSQKPGLQLIRNFVDLC